MAKEAENSAEERLSLGYVALTRILDGGQGQEELAAVRARLKGLKDGPFFVEQLDTALAATEKWRAGGRK